MTQRLVAVLSVGLVFGGCRVSIAPPESAVRAQGEPIQIIAPVPALPESLPVLALTPEIAPKDGINKLLNEERRDPQLPSVALVPLGQAELFRKQDIQVSQDLVGVVEGDRLRAWLDVSKGEAHIYPSFNRLKPRDASNPAATRERATKLLDTFRLLPNDDTKYALASERVVKQSVARRLADGTIQVEPAQTVLGYLSARRTFNGIPVDGPGSRAQLAFGAGDSVLGLTRIWKRAQISERTVRAPSALDIEKRIREQLAPIAQQATALVDDIQLVYYDGNAKLMQPAIRFTVQLTPFGARSTRDKVYLHGYVAFEETDETPPSLFGAAGDPPHAAKNNDIELPVTPSFTVRNLKLGRYVVRDDVDTWTRDANEFRAALSATAAGALIGDAEYVYAEPRLFTNHKDKHINAASVALIESHGEPWSFTTRGRCCEPVDFDFDIEHPGYGAAASGRLSEWILHSCEIVASPDDSAAWSEPWWTLFGGLRNVVGYRTLMRISDGAGAVYGRSLGYLTPIVSAWFTDVGSLNIYSRDDFVCGHNGACSPMGRAASISVCDHEDDSLASPVPAGRADCLRVTWMPDTPTAGSL